MSAEPRRAALFGRRSTFHPGAARPVEPDTSQRGNLFGMIGMTIAVLTTLARIRRRMGSWGLVIGGIALGGGVGAVIARRVPMTSMPELVAAFHSWSAWRRCWSRPALSMPRPLSTSAAKAIFTGEFDRNVARRCHRRRHLHRLGHRLSETVRPHEREPITLPGRHIVNLALAAGLIFFVYGFVVSQSVMDFWIIVALSLTLGVLIIIPIGGADMPVVISMLNSYSGWAAAGIGFTLGNSALIITGALVGSSGAILSYIMCKGMNRSFIAVILGGFGGETAGPGAGAEQRPVKLGSAEDAAYILKNSSKVIIVPGYGMAVAQAQHALREMADKLKKEGVEVKYAIHPVAGRMPGHMNVLLAEANVPYDEVFELEDINSEFAQADVAFVIGANDVTNPAAEDDKSSPIYGMPVLQVWKAGTVMFIKRSLASGYAGIDNPLFYRDNTMMLLGDAKKMTESIVKAM